MPRKSMPYYPMLIVVISLFSFSGCAPVINDGYLRVGPVPVADVAPIAPEYTTRALVDEVLFEYSPLVAGELRGRFFRLKTESAGMVRHAIQESLKRRGTAITALNAPTVKCTVTKWQVQTKPGVLFSQSTAIAGLRVIVIDPNGIVTYENSYSKVVEMYDLFPSSYKIENLLEQAMGFTVEELVNDKQFLSQLATGTYFTLT